ncbi:aldo/keto reductase [Apilactobacillus quenuiae]|uniref:aldo/keto reductase n=1 Tax=Apilactobacillus quenuiae TaxID=2008377 RepID=UPI000D020238|nr:aldo/keto reductase [Apilactobacillus quenuiae]
MKYFTLNDGNQIPANGFGTFRIPNTQKCVDSVTQAINAGYRLIDDTAEIYGNEEAVGIGINNSYVSKDELFITSKLWVNHYGYEKASKSIDDILKRLNTDYLDLLLLHQPFGDYYGAWRAMEDAQKQGKILSIVVSNFTTRNLIDLDAFNKVKLVINQIEINPWRQEHDSINNLNNLDVQVESWSPFAEGSNNLFHNSVLKKIAKKYNKTIAQIILRWEFQLGIVSLCKSVHFNRINENFNIYDFNLDNLDMKNISNLNKNYGSTEKIGGKLSDDDSENIIKYLNVANNLSTNI